MHCEQAVFTSSRSATRHGYHLVARSAGLGEPLAQLLPRWCPSHGALLSDDLQASSLNSFSLDSDWLAVARTVYGAPEYSGRGALQVVTVILVVRQLQLKNYQNNCLQLARTAKALGYLRLPATLPRSLPPVTLPDAPLLAAELPHPTDDATLSRSAQLLEQGQRIAIQASGDAEGLLANLLGRVPLAIRSRVSFATGLRPSQQRPFQVHFMPQLQASLQQRIRSQGIRVMA